MTRKGKQNRNQQKEEADRLNGYIDGTATGEQLDATSRQVVDALQHQVEQVQPSPQFVENLSARLEAEANDRSTYRSFASWLTMRFVPRLLWVGVGVALVALLVFWLPSLWPEQTALEPAADDETGVSSSDTDEPFTLPQTPAELRLFEIAPAAIPGTPEQALAWATDFGLPDPQVFTDPRSPGILVVMGSDDSTLSFQPGVHGGIYYNNGRFNVVRTSAGEPLSFSDAAESAVAFLAERNQLPEAYVVYEDPSQVAAAASANNPVRSIRISPDLGNGRRLDGGGGTPYADIQVGPDGEIVFAWLNPIQLTPAENVAIIPAQQVYDAFVQGEASPFRTQSQYIESAQSFQYFTPPPPVHQTGDEIEIKGWVNVLVAADGSEIRAILHGDFGNRYQLTGEAVTPMAEGVQPMVHEIEVAGRITAVTGPNSYDLEVSDWQPGPSPLNSYAPFTCLIGAFSREGDGDWLTVAEGGDRYRIPEAPAELNDGDRIELCVDADTLPATGSAVAWHSITSPPASEVEPARMEGGVTVVEEAVEVTRVVTEMPSTADSSGGAADAFTFIEPNIEDGKTVFELGASIVVTGYVDAVIFEASGDEPARTEIFVQLADENGLQGERLPLSGTEEQLNEMAQATAGGFVSISGGVVPMPAERWGPDASGLEVIDYEIVLPEARLRNFLGHIDLETIEGTNAAVFTDHETEEQYLIGWGEHHYTSDDFMVEKEQILVEGVVYPEATLAGLPILWVSGSGYGSDTAAATSADDFPPPAAPQIVPPMPEMPGADPSQLIIEHMEIVYLYEPQYDSSGPPSPDGGPPSLAGEQIAEPVWAIYSRSEDGTQLVTSYFRAVQD